MSNKFTGITSAGSAIPVYDKDAHSALEQKLDTSAFSSVSGEFATVDDVVAAVSGKADTSAIPSLDGYATEQWVGEQGYLTEVPESAVSGFATHEEVESATSGKADTSGVIDYFNKPDEATVWASGGLFHAKTADVQELYASGNSANYTIISPTQIYTRSGGVNTIDIQKFTATTAGITAAGIELSQNNAEISGGGYYGIQFRTSNTAMASAGIHYSANQNVPRYSPLFSAKNASGDGFAIWAGGAKGFDASGKVIWDAAAPAKLIGWNNYQGTALDPRAAGIDGSIIATVYPDNVPDSYLLSSNPHTYMNGYGFFASNPYSISISATTNNGIRVEHTGAKATASLTPADVSFIRYNGTLSANEVWSLTGSVQKREIECDSATSAITAIAGSAIGGKEYSAGANIDITDDVISGKDWSDEIVAATSGLMQTSGLEYDGDKISGYMGSAFAGGGDVPEGVMVESAVGYNAVNEISGYNGSAIAQYGAEKQWLQHDDTLVHAANSAQYALGVNLSAVAQLLGVDETVLFSGERPLQTTGQFNLNESPYNFKKIEIWAISYPTYVETLAVTFNTDNSSGVKIPFCSVGIDDSVAAVRFNISNMRPNASGINITNQKQYSIEGVNQTTTGNSPTIITKVIGIGRKQA